MGAVSPGGRCGFVLMMFRPLVTQQMNWLNVQVGDGQSCLDASDGDLYGFLAVLFMSHFTNLSMGSTRALFLEVGFTPPAESTCDLLTSKFCTLNPSYREGQSGEDRFAWHSWRDQTRFLTDFEHISYAIGKRLFFCAKLPMFHT